MKDTVDKIKPFKVYLPEEIKAALIARARKSLRSPEDEIIFIVVEALKNTPDEAVAAIIEIYEQLLKHKNKRNSRSTQK